MLHWLEMNTKRMTASCSVGRVQLLVVDNHAFLLSGSVARPIAGLGRDECCDMSSFRPIATDMIYD